MAIARYRHDPLKNLVGFLIGDVHYALPIHHVREIVNPLKVVALPNAASGVSGVADYRDEVVPVVDLRTRFGLVAGPATRRTKWILVDVGSRLVALVVDSVTEVFGTAGKDLRAAPALGGGEDVRGITGVTSHDEHMVFVLDTSRFGELTDSLVASGDIQPSALQGEGRSG
ncbi:MAG: cheW4 [Myxococcaceae bacterium]|nr:cheW4 [Myxococcaceae bacterium]